MFSRHPALIWVVSSILLLPVSSSQLSQTTSTSPNTTTSGSSSTPGVKESVTEKRSINSLLDHLSDLQDLAQLSSLPVGIGGFGGGGSSPPKTTPSSTSGGLGGYSEEDYKDPNYDNYDGGGTGSEDKSHPDDEISSSPTGSGGNGGGGRKWGHNSPRPHFLQSLSHPPPPLDTFRGYNADPKVTHHNGGGGDSYDDDDGDDHGRGHDLDRDPGYLDNAYYYPTTSKGSSGGQNSEDSIPFFPSHGVPVPGHDLPGHADLQRQPLLSPQEYRLPLYSPRPRGHKNRNQNTIPQFNYNYKEKASSFGLFPSPKGGGGGGRRGNSIDLNPGNHGGHSGHSFSRGPEKGGKNLPKFGSGGGSSTSSVFPFGLPLPPIPPEFGGSGGSGSRHDPDPNDLPSPRRNKPHHSPHSPYSHSASSPAYPPPVIRSGGYGVVPSPYSTGGGESHGESPDYFNLHHSASSSPLSPPTPPHTNGGSGGGESSYPHQNRNHSPRPPPPGTFSSPGSRGHAVHHSPHQEEDEVGYGGLSMPERTPPTHQHPPRPGYDLHAPTPPTNPVQSIANYNYNLNLQGISDAAEYESQLQLTNAATYSALQGLSPAGGLSPSANPPSSNNYQSFNNGGMAPGLSPSVPSTSLYDGLAGYGLGGGESSLNGLIF